MEQVKPMECVTIRSFRRALGHLPFAARRHRKTAEGGQSLAEFALMLPFMALLLIGVVEVGRAAFLSIVVTHGASAGVEYGAQNSTTMVYIAGMTLAATQDTNYSAMTVTPSYGCLCDNGSGTSCTDPVPGPGSCAGISCSGQIVQCVQVKTHATFDALFHYPGLPSTFQANGNAVMRVRPH